MKTLAALTLLMLSCSSTVSEPPTASEAPLGHRVVGIGWQARAQSEGGQIAWAGSESEYRALWDALIGSGVPPAIDFDREGALFIISSPRSTGGYEIELRQVSRKGDTLVVDAVVTPPPADAMTTQVITTPFVIAAVPRGPVARVEWGSAADVSRRQQRQ